MLSVVLKWIETPRCDLINDLYNKFLGRQAFQVGPFCSSGQMNWHFSFSDLLCKFVQRSVSQRSRLTCSYKIAMQVPCFHGRIFMWIGKEEECRSCYTNAISP